MLFYQKLVDIKFIKIVGKKKYKHCCFSILKERQQFEMIEKGKEFDMGLNDLIKQDKQKSKQKHEKHSNKLAHRPSKRFHPNDSFKRRKFYKRGEFTQQKDNDKTNSVQKSGVQGQNNNELTAKDQSLDLSKHLPKRKNQHSLKNHHNRNKEYKNYNKFDETRKNHSKNREQRREKGGQESTNKQKGKKSKEGDKNQIIRSKPVMLKFFGIPLDFSTLEIMKMFGNRQYYNLGSRMKEQQEKNGKIRRFLEVMVSFKHKQEADSFVQIYSAKLFDNRYLTFQMIPLKH